MNKVRYRRARFTTWLPTDRIYAPSHYWIGADGPGRWRVGLTGFAVRMLGDLVEYQFQAAVGQGIETGQTLGWIEGFKALSDIYAVMPGNFLGTNPALDADVTLFDEQHHDGGWLYAVGAASPPELMDVHEYTGLLDATIDRMLAAEREE